MSDVKWTDAQKDAINARGGPMIVSAAAGSGKTAVLSQRVIDIITDKDHPVDIDRFLIVTFTNLAADEMKQRIAKKLTELAQQTPLSENKNVIRQQMLLSKAQISTIDGFCSSLVREYFYTLDIPTDFRILDTEESGVLMSTACAAVFERHYEQGDPDFLTLIDMFSDAYSDGGLQENVIDLYDFLRAQPFPKTWLKEKLAMYSGVTDPAKTEWGRQLISKALMPFEYLRLENDKAVQLAAGEGTFTKAQTVLAEERKLIDDLYTLLQNGSWSDICGFFAGLKFKTMSFPRNLDEKLERLKKEIQTHRDSYKKQITGSIKALFSKDTPSFIAEVDAIRPVISTLFELVLELSDEYAAMKAERSAADYGDLEHWALELLVKETDKGIEFTDIAREISSRYDYVMVDEYQDVNMLQERIFNAVSDGDRKLFTVGDVKQSIYRFRQAMPEIFIDRKERSAPYSRDADNYPSKVNLDANFRSREKVTDCVNFIFKNIMSRKLGGLDYDDEEALAAKADYPARDDPAKDEEPAVSFHLIGAGELSDDDRVAAEARYAGRRILEIMKSETVYDKDTGSYRDVRFGDICIIMRSANKAAAVYIRELLNMGIPAVSEKGDSFFSQPEIRLMLSLLRVLENPARDIPLAAVLISPIFGFTPDEFGAIRAGSTDKSLYESIIAQKDTNEKARRFSEMFDKFRSVGSNVTSYELINRIYSETLLPEIVISGEDGEYRRKNLLMLLQYAKKYESSGFKGIGGFVSFIDRLAEYGKDLSAADRAGEVYDNSVKIMTTHKSKGLEFPVCIVSGLGKEFNEMDMEGDLVYNSRLGVGIDYYDKDRLYHYKGITRIALEGAMKDEMLSEEIRMLYVAMTRAKEKLLMIATVKDPEKTIKSAAKKLMYDGSRISPYTVGNAKGFFDWLVSCMLVSRDGDEIRAAAAESYSGGYCDSDISRWDIVIVPDAENEGTAQPADISENGDDETKDGSTPSTDKNTPDPDEVSSYLETIRKKLDRSYKFDSSCAIQEKVAASVLSKKESDKIYGSDYRPAFMTKDKMTGADKGTAMHNFAQYCDFEAAKKSVEDEKKRLVALGKLTEEQANSIKNDRVETFLNSELMKEMMSAKLEREYQFMVFIPAGIIYPELEPPFSEEKTVLQGAIDCLMIKDGEYTIIDYKTDYVKSPEELARMHEKQLSLYKYAVEEIFKTKVSRCVLWSFALGCEVELDI